MNLPTPASSVDENSLAAIALAPAAWRARTAAQAYLSLGWVPIPIESGSKAPGYGWHTRTWDSAAASLDDDFPPAAPRNVGVLLGEASTGLVDLDLDSPSITAWVDAYLPPTLVFGRVGKPRSHRIYQAPVAKCWRFQDPISKAMLLEVRSNGGQTVFPGSVHPSGEAIEWCAGGELTPCDAEELLHGARLCAAGDTLARYWPSAGGRHDAYVALCGGLLGAGVTECDVADFVRLLCTATRDSEVADRLACVRTTAARIECHEHVQGWQALHGLLSSSAVTAVRTWLDIQTLPTIIVQQHAIASNTESAVAALIGSRRVYNRYGKLVHIIEANALDADARKTAPIAQGTPTISAIGAGALREALSSNAHWVKYNTRAKINLPCAPPDHVLAALLERGRWEGLPRLLGVTETPAFRADGSLLCEPGYDASTGLFYAPNCKFLDVNLRPSKDEIHDAACVLFEPFAEFPYRRDCEALVPIAMILTSFARPMIRLSGVPIFGFDAPSKRSGKTIQVDIAHMIMTGRAAARVTWPAQGTNEECGKQLDAYAIKGARFVFYDNTETVFGCDALDAKITSVANVECRILGHSEILEAPWLATVCVSGNNLQIIGATAERCVLCRITPDVARPGDRAGFRLHPVLPWVEQQRPRLVRAALTLLAGYIEAGCPDTLGAWGGFDVWKHIVGGCVQWAYGVNLLDARPVLEEGHDPETAALGVVLEAIARHGTTRGITLRELMQKMGQPGIEDLAARDAAASLVGTKMHEEIDLQALGLVMRRNIDRVIGRYKLVRLTDMARSVAAYRAVQIGKLKVE